MATGAGESQGMSSSSSSTCKPCGKQVVETMAYATLPTTFLDCIPCGDTAALRSTDEMRVPLSYNNLRTFISTGLSCSATSGDVVAILLPNGPELAAAILAVAAHGVAAPLDTKMTVEEMQAAFQQLKPRQALIPSPTQWKQDNGKQDVDAAKSKAIMQTAAAIGCQCHFVFQPVGAASGWLQVESPAALQESTPQLQRSLHDTSLLLRTSGTTSKPKVVPLTGHGLMTGAAAIAHGLALTPDDVCLNVMPYTHIGGISCSLLASIFSGSTVFCATTFDPALFLQWLADFSPTWYYAAPTIHKAVMLVASASPSPVKHCLRLIRSGAANLPHNDALELRRIFGCTVLPTYSMSECMPIAQPPLAYGLDKPGSVGLPIGASVCIAAVTGEVLPTGEVGEVCLRGPVVTQGYLEDSVANSAAFFQQEGDSSSSWFRTGDLGHLDAEGYLFLTGRSKELIKRGGDQVSPYEVEEVLLAHPAVSVCLVFGVPNEFWGEEVAAVVITKDGKHLPLDGSASMELLRFAAQTLPEHKVPKQVVVLDDGSTLPKTSTGKYMRSRLAAHLGLSAVDLVAARGLAAATAFQAPTREGQHKPLKPHKAIYGVRYFFALWVIFVHVGPMQPGWVGVWRLYSFSMPGYFMLAGFLLASSYTGPIGSRMQFYRNRLVAAHPLYLLAMLYSAPYPFLVCPTDGNGAMGFRAAAGIVCGGLNIDYPMPWSLMHQKLPGSYAGQLTYSFVMTFFAQLAWPWGTLCNWLGASSNLILWFSSSYYFCLLCFPIFHHWLTLRSVSGRFARKRILGRYVINFAVWPVGVTFIATVCLIAYSGTFVPKAVDGFASLFRLWDPNDDTPQGNLRSLLHPASGDGSFGFTAVMLAAYTFPPQWALVFFLGMLLYRLLDMNRLPGTYKFPHWGIVTDCCTLLLLGSFPLASLLVALDGSSSAWAGPAAKIGTWWGGDQQHKLVMILLSVWLYGLGIGQGFSAKVFGSDFLVKYLSPAAYSVYLFHYQTNSYWQLVKANVMSTSLQKASWMPWLDYVLVAITATLVAMVAAHKLNAPLTSLFMRCIDAVFCCGNSQDEEQTSLEKVVDAVKGLTGADVGPDTPILECGLDSFGTSALLGIIKPKFPGLTLTPLEMYSLPNIQSLADRIDADLEARWRSTAPARQSLVHSSCDV
mmetsp:Transcript_46518/g.108440  ORF Transcript_46518/g.108440 Transcript_46518/m.108440 type:complete len:1166 (-) Transcript_46518:152-3649(-)